MLQRADDHVALRLSRESLFEYHLAYIAPRTGLGTEALEVPPAPACWLEAIFCGYGLFRYK